LYGLFGLVSHKELSMHGHKSFEIKKKSFTASIFCCYASIFCCYSYLTTHIMEEKKIAANVIRTDLLGEAIISSKHNATNGGRMSK